jgi:hypothetical protein
MKCQGTLLHDQQLRENMEWVQCHDANTIYNGYFCSTADPYLLLLSYLTSTKITHVYCSTTITYTPPTSIRYTMHFASNSGHIW